MNLNAAHRGEIQLVAKENYSQNFNVLDGRGYDRQLKTSSFFHRPAVRLDKTLIETFGAF